MNIKLKKLYSYSLSETFVTHITSPWEIIFRLKTLTFTTNIQNTLNKSPHEKYSSHDYKNALLFFFQCRMFGSRSASNFVKSFRGEMGFITSAGNLLNLALFNHLSYCFLSFRVPVDNAGSGEVGEISRRIGEIRRKDVIVYETCHWLGPVWELEFSLLFL